MQVHFLVTVHCNSGCYQLQSNCTYITTSWTYIGPQHSVLQPGLSSSTAYLAQHEHCSMHSTACLAQHAHCSTTTLTSRSQARWQNVAARLVSQHSMRSTAQHENAHQQSPCQVAECKPAAHTHCCPLHLSIQTGKWRQCVTLHMG